ncbi:MAG: class IV adenylate cyclase [Treponema sp.]|jgi:adenylate cyclase class 2|nr:class IV adenylate cyclase [Treponema sp.]
MAYSHLFRYYQIMAVEIELKAWVKDPEAQRSVISRLARYTGAYRREDAYWYASAASGAGVRVRRESSASPCGETVHLTLVTYKTKEVRDGIEVNHEREFEVSDGAVFEELLGRLGLARGAHKLKRGWSWDCRGITVELSEVEGLGWFAELEILADEDLPETVAGARRRLLELLNEIGIPGENIEGRCYTEMLRELTTM